MKLTFSNSRLLLGLLGVAGVSALSGCASSAKDSVAPPPISAVKLQGRVHGGQQPVSGAVIQLYAANLNANFTGSSTPLIASTVTTDANGAFDITGTYTCQPGDLLYIVGTGGNPGVSGTHNNSALTLMTGLGPCSTVLGTNRFIFINELTTVATAWALSPFMESTTQLDVASNNVTGLQQAFATINKLVDTTTGNLAGPLLPAGATLPVNEINTLADILAVCVNTVDSGSSFSPQCTNLSADIYPSSPPTDTATAALEIARSPQLGLALWNTPDANSPYQPTLGAAPTSWTIAINYIGGGLSAPKGIAVDYSGNVWIANSGSNSVTELDNTGKALSPANGFTAGAMSSPVALAVDLNNSIWVANSGNSTVTKLANSGVTGQAYTGGGLNLPKSIAVDPQDNIWVANYGNSSVTQLTNAGVPVSGPLGYTVGGISQPVAIAIDPY